MNDCLYGSARIRALENGLIGTERINRLLSAESTSSAYDILKEYGLTVSVDPKTGKRLKEETLEKRLQDAYAEVSNLSSESKAIGIWRYPYDCNNLKAVIKCKSRGVSPDSMLFDFGSVSKENLFDSFSGNDFSAFPKQLSSAVSKAMAEFAKTKNPQTVDLLLDKACYGDMLSDAEESKLGFAVGLVRKKIDLVNLLTFIRILRMESNEAGRMFLSDALIPGGTMEIDFFNSLYGLGEKAALQKLSYQSGFCKLGEEFAKTNASLTFVERLIDDCFMETVREARFIPYGEEVLISYLLAVEYEVRNVRIVLAGKETGLSTETIRERIRQSYV